MVILRWTAQKIYSCFSVTCTAAFVVIHYSTVYWYLYLWWHIR